jgi:hypothetical protein
MERIKTKVHHNMKRHDVRRITFRGKYIVQWYDGNNWRTYSVNKF